MTTTQGSYARHVFICTGKYCDPLGNAADLYRCTDCPISMGCHAPRPDYATQVMPCNDATAWLAWDRFVAAWLRQPDDPNHKEGPIDDTNNCV